MTQIFHSIANRAALVDGSAGVDIYPEIAPAPSEHVIKKHRYSGFYGTDLDMILREWGIDTVIISGTTTENCCHATARDAMSRFDPTSPRGTGVRSKVRRLMWPRCSRCSKPRCTFSMMCPPTKTAVIPTSTDSEG